MRVADTSFMVYLVEGDEKSPAHIVAALRLLAHTLAQRPQDERYSLTVGMTAHQGERVLMLEARLCA